MSFLVRNAHATIDAIARGEAVSVFLPNGSIVQAVPRAVVGAEGQPLVEIDVAMDDADGEGVFEARVRMPPHRFERAIEKARSYAPRLEVIQRRLLTRG